MNILNITASAQNQQAQSSQLSLYLAQGLQRKLNSSTIIERNLHDSELPLLKNEWVAANLTPADKRLLTQKQELSLSDFYVQELIKSDVIVIGSPIYNFSVPAALKAYIDLICRAGLTFKYTDKGPVGLLENKEAYIVVTSGGVQLNSAVDFATPYLIQVLKFIGITQVTVIDAARIKHDHDGSIFKHAKITIDQHIDQYKR